MLANSFRWTRQRPEIDLLLLARRGTKTLAELENRFGYYIWYYHRFACPNFNPSESSFGMRPKIAGPRRATHRATRRAQRRLWHGHRVFCSFRHQRCSWLKLWHTWGEERTLPPSPGRPSAFSNLSLSASMVVECLLRCQNFFGARTANREPLIHVRRIQ